MTDEIDPERGREILAERLGWPQNAPTVCGHIEKRFPGYYAWWTPLPYPDPGFRPAWGAARINRRPLSNPNLYARSPAELAELIEAANAERIDA